MKTDAVTGIRDQLRELAGKNAGRLKLARRAVMLAAFIGLAIYLSAIGLIAWAVVVFVGIAVVEWARRTARASAIGEAVRNRRAGYSYIRRPFPGPSVDLAGISKAIAIPVAGATVLAIILIPLGWWSAASAPLRSILEALPFGDAVAVTPSQHGNPLAICLLAAAGVGLAIWAVSKWRIRSVRNYLYGGNTFVQIFTVGLIRTVVIFGGITLVPVLGTIAAGADLRDDPNYTFTGPIPPLIVIACWLAFAYVDLRRVFNREAERPPRPGPADSMPARSDREPSSSAI